MRMSRLQEAMNITPPDNSRLKEAVNSVQVPSDLGDRVRRELRAAELFSPPVWDRFRGLWFVWLVPASAVIALTSVSVGYHFGYFRLTDKSRDSYIASLSSHVSGLIGVGLVDHIHCAVFRKYPQKPLTIEAAVLTMPARYAQLVPIVRSKVSKRYGMTFAHQCAFRGRKFVHLSFKDDANLLSLIITRKMGRESFRAENMLPVFDQSGIAMYQAGVQRFEISAFETQGYMVYFISDLHKQQNTDMMLAIAPQVKAFLTKLDR